MLLEVYELFRAHLPDTELLTSTIVDGYVVLLFESLVVVWLKYRHEEILQIELVLYKFRTKAKRFFKGLNQEELEYRVYIDMGESEGKVSVEVVNSTKSYQK